MLNRKTKKYSCFCCNIKTKDGRGIGDDPSSIVDAMEDIWDELNEKLEGEDQMATDLKEIFNT